MRKSFFYNSGIAVIRIRLKIPLLEHRDLVATAADLALCSKVAVGSVCVREGERVGNGAVLLDPESYFREELERERNERDVTYSDDDLLDLSELLVNVAVLVGFYNVFFHPFLSHDQKAFALHLHCITFHTVIQELFFHLNT